MGLRATQLLKQSAIALDSNIFIVALEENRQFPLAIELIRSLPKSKTKTYTSVLSLLEAAVPSYRTNDRRRVNQVVELIYGEGRITVLPVDRTIALRAAQLRARFPKLKAPDAIQLATAIIGGVDTFITTDKDFGAKKLGHRTIEGVQIEVI